MRVLWNRLGAEFLKTKLNRSDGIAPENTLQGWGILIVQEEIRVFNNTGLDPLVDRYGPGK